MEIILSARSKSYELRGKPELSLITGDKRDCVPKWAAAGFSTVVTQLPLFSGDVHSSSKRPPDDAAASIDDCCSDFCKRRRPLARASSARAICERTTKHRKKESEAIFWATLFSGKQAACPLMAFIVKSVCSKRCNAPGWNITIHQGQERDTDCCCCWRKGAERPGSIFVGRPCAGQRCHGFSRAGAAGAAARRSRAASARWELR